MPLGLLAAELSVVNPGDKAEVTVYFSEPAPEGARWFVYDSVDGWIDYSKPSVEGNAKAVFSSDRKSVTLKLKDWGYGDTDDIPNGTIVDPGGFGLASWIKGSVSDVYTGKAIN